MKLRHSQKVYRTKKYSEKNYIDFLNIFTKENRNGNGIPVPDHTQHQTASPSWLHTVNGKV